MYDKKTLRGILARAYCTKRNESKVLDDDLIEDMVTALESLDSEEIEHCQAVAMGAEARTEKDRIEISRLEKLVEVGRECAKGLIEVSESIQNDSIGEGEHPAKIAERYIEKAKKEGLIG